MDNRTKLFVFWILFFLFPVAAFSSKLAPPKCGNVNILVAADYDDKEIENAIIRADNEITKFGYLTVVENELSGIKLFEMYKKQKAPHSKNMDKLITRYFQRKENAQSFSLRKDGVDTFAFFSKDYYFIFNERMVPARTQIEFVDKRVNLEILGCPGLITTFKAETNYEDVFDWVFENRQYTIFQGYTEKIKPENIDVKEFTLSWLKNKGRISKNDKNI